MLTLLCHVVASLSLPLFRPLPLLFKSSADEFVQRPTHTLERGLETDPNNTVLTINNHRAYNNTFNNNGKLSISNRLLFVRLYAD